MNSNNNQAGKGDKQRPTDKKCFDANFSQIKWNTTDNKLATKNKNKTTFRYK
jgi:hypothetical protein